MTTTKLEELFASVGDKNRLDNAVLEFVRQKEYFKEERDKNVLRSEISMLLELISKYGSDVEYLRSRLASLKPTNYKY